MTKVDRVCESQRGKSWLNAVYVTSSFALVVIGILGVVKGHIAQTLIAILVLQACGNLWAWSLHERIAVVEIASARLAARRRR